MTFKKYQHLERFGTTEVENIESGNCYIFPKIDGTNGSIWKGEDGHPHFGSRNRELSLDNDNAGFMEWGVKQENLLNFFDAYPELRLFGEWLVPHALKTYREDAWRRFYVFDVVQGISEDEYRYLPYDEYSKILDEFAIDYILPICTIKNSSYEQLIRQLDKNVFLIEDGKGVGEGIVIKNYDYKNKYGRTTWAKIVTSEFKEKHAKAHGNTEMKGKKMVEEEIAEEFVTRALCEKVYAKIDNDTGFRSKDIPRLLNTVYYDLINEESWNYIKKHKNPTINYSTLNHFVTNKVKQIMTNIF